MNKLDFLRRLDRELAVLDKEERKEILAFYEERFYTGTIYENKTEEEVIGELESPEVIAKNVLAEYGVSPRYVKTSEERYSNINIVQVILLLSFDLIVATWLIPTLFSVAISIFGTSFTWFGSIGLLFGDTSTVDEFVFAFVTAAYVLYFLFGLVVLGASIFATKTIITWHLNVFKIKGRDKWIKRMSKISVDGWFKRHKKLNSLKNLLLVGALVTIGYTGFWIFNHYDWVEAEYGTGELVSETFTEDLASEITLGDQWDIVTDFGSMDVEIVIVSGTDLNIKHTYYEDDQFTYDFDYDNNVLTISNEDLQTQFFWNFQDLFQLISGSPSVRIEVPDTLILDALELETTNGEVDLRNVDFHDLSVDTSNGPVTLSNIVVVGDITVHTSNGSILIQDVSAGNNSVLDVETSNGTIEVQDVDFMEYYIWSSNGRITLDNLNVALKDGEIIEVDTSNGSIYMDEVYVDDIDLHTSNGNIEFYNEDTTFLPTSFEKSTTNGQISTNVR